MAGRSLRNMTPEKRRMYMRRRIVAIVVIIALICAIVGGIVAVAHMVTKSGDSAQPAQQSTQQSDSKSADTKSSDAKSSDGKSSDNAQSSKDTAAQKQQEAAKSIEERLACKASQMEVTLAVDSNTVGVGGTVNFTTTVTYKGKNQCLADLSAQKEVLTISTVGNANQSGNADQSSNANQSGNADQKGNTSENQSTQDSSTSSGKVVWQSSVCPADPRNLLFAQGAAGSDQATDKVTTAWNTNATGDTCEDDKTLPHVIAGTYQAQVTFPEIKGLKSQIVPIVVQ